MVEQAQTLRVLDVFSGIGGFSLGLERAGMKTVAFCEIDPYCRRVLARHWPEVPCYDDIRTLNANQLQADGITVDVICGGFPCQDISFAGKGAGLKGKRSGLWSEIARLAGELRPRFIIVENVAAMLYRGLDTVLGDLAALRYDAEWHCIPASAIGAPHRRDRIWIVAYADSRRRGADPSGRDESDRENAEWQKANGLLGAVREASSTRLMAYAKCERIHKQRFDAKSRQNGQQLRGILRNGLPGGNSQTLENVAHANCSDAQGIIRWRDDTIVRKEQVERQARLCNGAGQQNIWSVEPHVGRVAHGIPSRVDRLRCLGNAVVPQIPELIGRAIIESRI